MDIVKIKNFDEPNININEVYRYCGVKAPDSMLKKTVNECLKECEGVFKYSVCFTITSCDSLFENVESTLLKTRLKDCEKAVLFAATVGIGIDRLIEKYGRISPSKALVFQAIGAERIESLCDIFCDDLKKENLFLTNRFSPGYGDFPLMRQMEIFSRLDCVKKIGLTLNDSLVMSPSKSVTAVMGISDKFEMECENKCGTCDKTDCSFRRVI